MEILIDTVVPYSEATVLGMADVVPRQRALLGCSAALCQQMIRQAEGLEIGAPRRRRRGIPSPRLGEPAALDSPAAPPYRPDAHGVGLLDPASQ